MAVTAMTGPTIVATPTEGAISRGSPTEAATATRSPTERAIMAGTTSMKHLQFLTPKTPHRCRPGSAPDVVLQTYIQLAATVIGRIHSCIHRRVSRGNGPIDIDDVEFFERQSDLLESATNFCEQRLRVRPHNHCGYMYLTREFELYVTAGPSDYEAIKRAWIPKEEIVRLEGKSKASLKKIWKACLEEFRVRFKRATLQIEEVRQDYVHGGA
ncbi:hypothetical protein F5Y00DRAFT_262782 [Daldinia vernicosa]|uniref:uncharacterized protein n=1 Tax=Daldinia vernicosa TaxID=114800 RepID=UPI002007403F|nr:uncharacterized protein F5Y00DRAFT_262782 [Daldinia vernicosa]KAI0848149.1 hypothetical protein F5Y00DRAFT_262782 [Daldinia vernicosa]